MPGPEHSSSSAFVTTEPYLWTPAASVGWPAWVDAITGAVTLTLDDGVATLPAIVDPGTATAEVPQATLSASPADPSPVAADLGEAAAPAPLASLTATPASDPVAAEPGTATASAPIAALTATVLSGSPAIADPGTATAEVPQATLSATPADPSPIAADLGEAAAPAPLASLAATPASDPVAAEPGTATAAIPTAALTVTAVSPMPVAADPGETAAPAPAADLTATRVSVSPELVEPGTSTADAPAASLSASAEDVTAPTAARERLNARSLSGVRQKDAIEIKHSSLSTPIRLVSDTVEHRIDGEIYERTAFNFQAPQDEEGQVRTSELRVDNVGRRLMELVRESNGGRGVTMRAMRVVPAGAGETEARIAWQVTMFVGDMRVTNREVTISLTHAPIFDRPSVLLRHDPATSPGLF